MSHTIKNISVFIFILVLGSCSNSEQTDSIISSNLESTELQSDLMINLNNVIAQIQDWTDSTICMSSQQNSDKFMLFKFVTDSTFTVDDSTLFKYSLTEKKDTVTMLFERPTSAVDGVPSINGMDIYEISNGTMYGIEKVISPEQDYHFNDSLLMYPFMRNM